MRASWIAVRKLSGVAVPSCSWGSSQREARPACQARTSLPLAAAPTGNEKYATLARVRTTSRRSTSGRTVDLERLMSCPFARSGRGLVFAEPHVLELLVRVVVRRRHVVLHLRPVHHGPRPPDARDVVDMAEHELLDLEDELLALHRVERPRLAVEEVVDPRIGEAAPVVAVARRIALEELVGGGHEVERRGDHELEVAGVAAVGEPGRRLQLPMPGLHAHLSPPPGHQPAASHL